MFGGGARNVEAEVGSVRRESRGERAAAEVPTLCHTWTEKRPGRSSKRAIKFQTRMIGYYVYYTMHIVDFLPDEVDIDWGQYYPVFAYFSSNSFHFNC